MSDNEQACERSQVYTRHHLLIHVLCSITDIVGEFCTLIHKKTILHSLKLYFIFPLGIILKGQERAAYNVKRQLKVELLVSH